MEGFSNDLSSSRLKKQRSDAVGLADSINIHVEDLVLETLGVHVAVKWHNTQGVVKVEVREMEEVDSLD